jgi:hypothetical protein
MKNFGISCTYTESFGLSFYPFSLRGRKYDGRKSSDYPVGQSHRKALTRFGLNSGTIFLRVTFA